MDKMNHYPTVGEVLAQPLPTEDTFTARGLLYSMRWGLTALHDKKEATASLLQAQDPELQPELPLDEQAQLLLFRTDRTPVNAFASSALRIGVKRLDAARTDAGRQPVHEYLLDSLLTSQEMTTRFDAGYHEVITGLERNLPAAVRRLVLLVGEHVDWRLNNPALAYNVVGGTRQRELTGSRPVFITASMDGVMRSEGWSNQQRALAGAVGMYQTALRNTRQLVTPLLSYPDNLPSVREGAEQTYWRSRLFGSGENEGLCYYLGYVEKSRARLRSHMQQLWVEDYSRNRNVFMTTLLLRTQNIGGPRSKEEVRALRRPIYRAIAENDFAGAEAQLAELAADRPKLFSPIALEYFAPEVAARYSQFKRARTDSPDRTAQSA
jgi:hypothetical protein